MPATGRSTVLTLRVPADLDRRIQQAARRKKRTKSALLREALGQAFGDGAPDDPAREARHQSLLVGGRPSEREALAFVRRRRRPGVAVKRGAIVIVAARGAYTGKPRPAVIVRSDLFNPTHASVSICPITSDIVDAPLFRLTVPPGRGQD